MHPHEFRKTLLGYVKAYTEHDSEHERTDDKAEKKRIADRRRRAADSIARTCAAVADTLDDDCNASGGYRATLADARRRLPPKAHTLLDGLPCDDVRAWSPDATYRCPHCDLVGPATEDFGARLEAIAHPAADVARLRAWWLDPSAAGAGLPERQRKRIAAFAPYPHPTRKGSVYALTPFRQSNCNPCRSRAAAKRSAQRARAAECG
jgi:hypothetical protein